MRRLPHRVSLETFPGVCMMKAELYREQMIKEYDVVGPCVTPTADNNYNNNDEALRQKCQDIMLK